MNTIIFVAIIILTSSVFFYFFKDHIIDPRKVIKEKDDLVRNRLKSFKTIDEKIFSEIIVNLKKYHSASLRIFDSEEDITKKRTIKYNCDMLISGIKKLELSDKPDKKVFKEIITTLNYLSRI